MTPSISFCMYLQQLLVSYTFNLPYTFSILILLNLSLLQLSASGLITQTVLYAAYLLQHLQHVQNLLARVVANQNLRSVTPSAHLLASSLVTYSRSSSAPWFTVLFTMLYHSIFLPSFIHIHRLDNSDHLITISCLSLV